MSDVLVGVFRFFQKDTQIHRHRAFSSASWCIPSISTLSSVSLHQWLWLSLTYPFCTWLSGWAAPAERRYLCILAAKNSPLLFYHKLGFSCSGNAGQFVVHIRSLEPTGELGLSSCHGSDASYQCHCGIALHICSWLCPRPHYEVEIANWLCFTFDIAANTCIDRSFY